MNIKYCFVKLSYLQMVYDKELIDRAKFINRPFIYLPDLHVAIVIPELTNHNNFDSTFNFYINKNKNYLDVASMIYVNEDNLIINDKLNNKLISKLKIQEISNKNKELVGLIKLVEQLTDLSDSFRSTHMHIERSKKLLKK